MQKIDGRMISIVLTNEQLDRLDKIAKKQGLKRADVTRRIIDTGLDAYDTFALVGIPQMAGLVRRTRKACEKEIQPSLI